MHRPPGPAWPGLAWPFFFLERSPKARVQDRVEGALNITMSDSHPLPMPSSSERGWDLLGWCGSPWNFLGPFLLSQEGRGFRFLLIGPGLGEAARLLIMPRGQPLPATQCAARDGNRLRQG